MFPFKRFRTRPSWVLALACTVLLAACPAALVAGVPTPTPTPVPTPCNTSGAVDLRTWAELGNPANGTWTVSPDGLSVTQSINGDPTFFVSPMDAFNTTIRGRLRVNAGSGDDDLIGFAFGYNAPGTTVAPGIDDYDMLLLDWKAATQSSGGFTAQEGLALSRVQGTISNLAPGFWGHTDSPGWHVLGTDYGPLRGWVAGQEYVFELLYQEHRIRIKIDDAVIFDVEGDFPSGKFAFYNYSQAGVVYSQFTEYSDPKVALASEGYTAGEESGAAQATVELCAPALEVVTVDYHTVPLTATEGDDYAFTSGTLTFQPGETSKLISVPVNNDTAVEPEETFLVEISNPVNALLSAPSAATVTISNDDVPTPTPSPTPSPTLPPTGGRVLFVNLQGFSYDADAANIANTITTAGGQVVYVNLSSEGQAASLLHEVPFDQIWVFDLSTGLDTYAADYQAIGEWYAGHPGAEIICDGRMISSYWNGRYLDEGQRLTTNYFENLRIRGGGLVLGTDHDAFHSLGMNNLCAALGLNPFIGNFFLFQLPVDTNNPLVTYPNDMGGVLFDDSSPGQTPYGLQPNGRILFTVAWHSGNTDTPGISSTIEGGVGFHVAITAPETNSTYPAGSPVPFVVLPVGGDPPYEYTWTSNLDGEFSTGDNFSYNELSAGTHTITVLGRDEIGRVDDDTVTVNIVAPTPTPTPGVTPVPTATPPVAPRLSLSKLHTDDFFVGAPGRYVFTVRNIGTGPTTGPITVADVLPSGLSYLTGEGDGWNFESLPPTVLAVWPETVPAGGEIGFTLLVNVDAGAMPAVVNSATATTPGAPPSDADTDDDQAPVILDTTAPGAPEFYALAIRPTNINEFRLKGRAEARSTVSIFVGRPCTGVPIFTGIAEDFNSPGFPMKVPDDSVTYFYATSTDRALNVSECSILPATYFEDSTAPAAPVLSALSVPSPFNRNTLRVTGTAEAASIVSIYAGDCSGAPLATGAAETFAGEGIVVSVPDDSTTVFVAKATDIAGNDSACSANSLTYVEDSTPPSTPLLLATTPESPGNTRTPYFLGTAEPGTMVFLHSNPDCVDAPIIGGTAAEFSSPGLPVLVSGNATKTVYAVAIDTAGNASECSDGFAYVEDDDPPAVPVLVAMSPTGPSADLRPRILGFADAGSIVSISNGYTCDTEGISFVGTAEALMNEGIPVPPDAMAGGDRPIRFWATAHDAAGNTSACSGKPLEYILNSESPAPPARLHVWWQPTVGVVNVPLSGMRVSFIDQSGQTVTDAGGAISLKLLANPGGGQLFGTSTRSVEAGAADFTGLRINRVGEGYTLAVTAPGLETVVTRPFAIMPPGTGAGLVLGFGSDPAGLDVNGDGVVDAADLGN